MVKKIPAETYFGEKILANSDAEKKNPQKLNGPSLMRIEAHDFALSPQSRY